MTYRCKSSCSHHMHCYVEMGSSFYFKSILLKLRWSQKGTFKKYVPTRFPSFDPHSPLVCPCSFLSTRTPPLHLIFYTCEIQRKEINEYQYLWLNSKCLLRSHCGISIKWTPLVHDKCLLYGDVHFIESPSKNQVFKSKHEIQYLS